MIKQNLNKEQKLSVIDFFEKYNDSNEATFLFNKHWGTNYNKRTLQQIFSNYKLGFEEGIIKGGTDIALERIAQKELYLMEQQKKNAIIKQEANKVARKNAQRQILLDDIARVAKIPLGKNRARIQTIKNSSNIVDLVIADVQYKGNEQEWVRHIFDTLISELDNLNILNTPTEFRIVFLGDDIEGAAAHPESQYFANNTSVVEQVVQISKLYAEGINRIVDAIDLSRHSVSLVLLPWSNHGMFGGTGKNRYTLPDEDFGLLIREWVTGAIDSNVYLYPTDEIRFVIDTGDTVYLHGHQTFMKNEQKLHTLGIDKDLFQGHLHAYQEIQDRNRIRYTFGTCRKDLQAYERLAGYSGIRPEVAIVVRENSGTRHVHRLAL